RPGAGGPCRPALGRPPGRAADRGPGGDRRQQRQLPLRRWARDGGPDAQPRRRSLVRSLPGLIVVDSIDMESLDSRDLLLERLREALADDRVPSQITPISAF